MMSKVVAVVGRRSTRGWIQNIMVQSINGHSELLQMPTANGRTLSEGFEWGYNGQGPRALGVALLALATDTPFAGAEASLVNQGYDILGFARDVVANLPQSDFKLTAAYLTRVAGEFRTRRSA